ncbi:MAG TPA: TetR/AcrR family transcriptional regulator [Marmoricola sp.]|nr:TetR/AcrR family transcriptional regulator [Marmoricola sp.]
MPDGAYHHGDLRNALIKAALDLLNESGPEGVSLRAVARRAGVSHAAPYHHFVDKAALMDAVALTGFKMLRDAIMSAHSEAELGLQQYRQAGMAYARFGFDNEALFRLMFRPGATDRTEVWDFARAMYDEVREASANAAPDVESRLMARTGWVAIHGTTMLILDGLLEADTPQEREQLLEEITMMLGLGFIPR